MSATVCEGCSDVTLLYRKFLAACLLLRNSQFVQPRMRVRGFCQVRSRRSSSRRVPLPSASERVSSPSVTTGIEPSGTLPSKLNREPSSAMSLIARKRRSPATRDHTLVFLAYDDRVHQAAVLDGVLSSWSASGSNS